MLVKFFNFFAFLFLITTAVLGQSIGADPLTGRPIAGLPIWTVNAGDLSASISLNYNGTPKVNDGESTAGMGWSVSAGGAVYREVRSLPDDYVGTKSGIVGDNRFGWLHANFAKQANDFTPSADLNYTICTDEIADFNTLSNFGYTNDTEPDIFSFNAPGLSGQFVFDRNKIIQTIPYQDVKIQVTRSATDSLINQIQITNNLGVKYTFQAGDKVTRQTIKKSSGTIVSYLISLFNYYQTQATYYRSWYLTQISSPTGSVINFVYGNNYDSNSPFHAQVVNSSNTIDTLYSVNDNTRGQLLQSISGSNETATLQWNGAVVGSVTITDNTYNQVKKFNFKYNYIKSTSTYYSSKNEKRSFLSELVEEVNCGVFPGYKFDYYGIDAVASTTTIPFNSPLAQDVYGYYNGTALSLVPEVYVKTGDTGTDGERYRNDPATGYSLIAAGGGRGVDTSKVYFGALKKIIQPSGGYSLVKYEPAYYYDAVSGTTLKGSGVRVRCIKTSAGDLPSEITQNYTYKTKSGLSSGKWVYKPMFAIQNAVNNPFRVPLNMAPEELILYSRVEISTNGRGKTVYEFQSAAMYPTTAVSDFNASLTRLARSNGNCISLGGLRSGYYTYPFAVNTNYDFERGLPFRISDYTRDGKLVSKKIYSYQRTTLPVNQISGIRFEFNGIFQYSKYTLLSNINKVSATETSRMYDQTLLDSTKYIETVDTYYYNANQMINQIAKSNSDGTSFYKTFQYAKDYATTGTDTQSQMINALVANNQHGTMIETTSKNGATVTGAQLILFNNTFGANRVLPMQQLVLGDNTGFTPSSVSGTVFTKSANYYPVSYMDSYDNAGNLIASRDQSRITRSVILGCNNSFPVLDIMNARYDQVAFTDFEPTLSSNAIVNTGTLNSTSSWSGKNSLTLNPGNTVTQSTVIKGAGNYYRFTCWVKSSSSATINVLINGVSSNTVSYTTTGTWKYLEARINLTSIAVNTAFAFQLSTTASVSLDNVAFYPESAEIVAHTYEPLNGKTADIDSRGGSGFKEYDAMGRLHYVRNTDKDIVQIKDFHYKSPNIPLPNSHFGYSPSFSSIYTNTSVTFTADPSCIGGVTYAWYVDNIAQAATTSTFNYTFPLNKDYRVKLLTTTMNGSTATEIIVHPKPVISATVTKATGESSTFNCQDATFQRHLTANVSGCFESANTTYRWSGPGIPSNPGYVITTANTFTVDLSSGSNSTYTCVVNTTCLNTATGIHEPISYTTTITFTWQVITGC